MYRWIEMLTLFWGLPVAAWLLFDGQGWLFPTLWAAGGAATLLLLISPTFDNRRLLLGPAGLAGWRRGGVVRRELGRVIARFVLLGSLLVLAVWALDAIWTANPDLLPDRYRRRQETDGFTSILFMLPREMPALWAAIMVGYPLFSVVPQEILWRAFFEHRYARLFARTGGAEQRPPAAPVDPDTSGKGPSTAAVIPTAAAGLFANAAAFAWAHIVFDHWVAVVMCLPGGWLFAQTYRRTGSVLAASIEHALYGCLIFTAGLGLFFFSGATG